MNWRRIVFLGLGIVFVVAVVYFVKKGASLPEGYQFEERAVGEAVSPGVTEQQGTAGAKPVTVATPDDVEKSLEKEKTFTYSGKTLRNPMAPLLAKPDTGERGRERGPQRVGEPGLAHRIEGIMWSSANPLAIINGNVVGVGEKLRDGSSVTEISRNFVALKRGGKTFRLVLE